MIKGGGGEAERPAAKATAAHGWRGGAGRTEWLLPPLLPAVARDRADTPDGFARLWRGNDDDPVATQTVIGTIALALLALEPGLAPEDADRRAAVVWAARNGEAGNEG